MSGKVQIMVTLPPELVEWLDREVVGDREHPREGGYYGRVLPGIKRRSRSSALVVILQEWREGLPARDARLEQGRWAEEQSGDRED